MWLKSVQGDFSTVTPWGCPAALGVGLLASWYYWHRPCFALLTDTAVFRCIPQWCLAAAQRSAGPAWPTAAGWPAFWMLGSEAQGWDWVQCTRQCSQTFVVFWKMCVECLRACHRAAALLPPSSPSQLRGGDDIGTEKCIFRYSCIRSGPSAVHTWVWILELYGYWCVSFLFSLQVTASGAQALGKCISSEGSCTG